MIVKIAVRDNDFTDSIMMAVKNVSNNQMHTFCGYISKNGIEKTIIAIRRACVQATMFKLSRMECWRSDNLTDNEYLLWIEYKNRMLLDYLQKIDMTIEQNWPKSHYWNNGEDVWIDSERNIMETR